MKNLLLKLLILTMPFLISACYDLAGISQWNTFAKQLCTSTSQQDCFVKKGNPICNKDNGQCHVVDADRSIKLLKEENGLYFVQYSNNPNDTGWISKDSVLLLIRANNKNTL